MTIAADNLQITTEKQKYQTAARINLPPIKLTAG